MTMTPERWQEIEDILDEVMPLETDQRAARLDRLCHDDATLRSQVEEMMGFCEQVQAGAFLENPPHLAAQDLLGSILDEDDGVDLRAGTRVGPYTIVAPLGQLVANDNIMPATADIAPNKPAINIMTHNRLLNR